MAENIFTERLKALLSNYPVGVTDCLVSRLKAKKHGYKVDMVRPIRWDGYKLESKEVYNIIELPKVRELIAEAGYEVGFVVCN